MLDLIIIGAGPAGITAGVYAARKKMELVVISPQVGGQAAWSGDVENYTGYQFITGPELAAKFEEHMRKFGIMLREGEQAVELRKVGEMVRVKTDRAVYEARTAIIASGKRSRQLGVPGETQFKNKGLTYCATCDGPLFAGKDVAVVGGGNSALDAAMQLIRIARRVYVINLTSRFTGDPVMQEKIKAAGNVTVLHNARVVAVDGSRMLDSITVDQAGKEQSLGVRGVFVEIGLTPNSEFAPELEKNELGEIKVNNRNETNIPGIFAAGDVTDVPEKQIIIAAGEGAKAALSVFRYMAQHTFS
ncbi:MAG TPA: FAD-dependent oxidoreductase [Patescibacteria group bacterium]|nr:FAD-dependent oxidoreductase [Patescibacteria group bacterium]